MWHAAMACITALVSGMLSCRRRREQTVATAGVGDFDDEEAVTAEDATVDGKGRGDGSPRGRGETAEAAVTAEDHVK